MDLIHDEKEYSIKTKNDYAYEFLRRAILTGQLKQGSLLNTSKIAEQLEMSGIPVREALRKLQTQRLVTIHPHKGAFVYKLSKKEIADNMAAQELIEPEATKLASLNICEDTIKALENNMKDMEKAVNNQDYLQYALLNREFHFIIYSACGNQELIKIISQLWDTYNMFKGLFALDQKRVSESLKEHWSVIHSLAKGDGEMAADIIRQHKRESYKQVYEKLENGEND
jgi:DNA-binding GntR family transcriptional regulator